MWHTPNRSIASIEFIEVMSSVLFLGILWFEWAKEFMFHRQMWLGGEFFSQIFLGGQGCTKGIWTHEYSGNNQGTKMLNALIS